MTQQTYLVASCNCGAVVNILEEFARDIVLQKLIHKIDCCRHPHYSWAKERHEWSGIETVTGTFMGTTGVLMGTTGLGFSGGFSGVVGINSGEWIDNGITGSIVGASGGTIMIGGGRDFSGLWSPVPGVITTSSESVSSALTPERGPTGDLLKVELNENLEDLVDEKKERMERVIQGVVQGFW